MTGVELVVFDLAGTTVRDDGRVAAAFVSALAEHGIDVTPEELARVRGASKREAVLRFIPAGTGQPRLAEAAYASFRARLSRDYGSRGPEPIPGAREVFERLRKEG